MSKNPTTKDLVREKRQQAALSLTTAGLGATALGTKGASWGMGHAAKRNPAKAANYLKRAGHLDRTSLAILTTGAGIGSVSGYKFARVQREEARRMENNQRTALSKAGRHSKPKQPSNFGQKVGETTSTGKKYLKQVGGKAAKFGAKHPYASTAAMGAGLGAAILTPGILASQSTAKYRVKRARGQVVKAKGFDPESRRQNRLGAYTGAMGAGAGVLGAAAVKPAKEAAQSHKTLKALDDSAKAGSYATRDAAALKALKRGGAAGALAIGAGGTAMYARKGGQKHRGWYS